MPFMRALGASAIVLGLAAAPGGCALDFARFDPSGASGDARAPEDAPTAESGGNDAQGAGDTASLSDGGDAEIVDTGGPADASDEESGASEGGGRDGGVRDGGGLDGAGTDAAPTTFTIGGMLRGLGAGGTVTLQDNGGDDLTLSMNGRFVFSKGLPSGAAYAVSVSAQPQGQMCSVMGGSGSVGMSNVMGINVRCR
jgi:hypothetical protein